VTGLSLFALARQRARHYARLTTDYTRDPAPYWPWYAFAGGVLFVAAVLFGVSHGASVDVHIVIIFVVAVAAFPTSSLIIRAILRGRPIAKPFLTTNLETRATQVRVAGDLLVAVWIAVWVLGPFKALVSPLLLAAAGQFTGTAYAGSAGLLVVFEIVLLLLAIAAPTFFGLVVDWRLRLAAQRNKDEEKAITEAAASDGPGSPVVKIVPSALSVLARAIESEDPNPDDPSAKAVTRLGLAALIISLLGVLSLLILPTYVADVLGPVGTLVLALGCWSTIVGTIIVALGRVTPFELFQVLRLRSTPIVTLLVVVPLIISFVDVPPTLHAVRTAPGSSALGKRNTVKTALDNWKAAQKGCETQLANGEYIQPLLLFAAQGGGIRAATWTVDVMRSIAGDGGAGKASAACASGATFLSSGASGGSIGLATFRQSGNAISNPAKMSTAAYRGPNALAGDVAGLLDGDLLGGLTGVRVATPTNLANPVGQWVWHDRTALQELAWQSEIPQFAKPYDVKRESPTGYLILNSEDSVTRCKVVVSQLNLQATKNAPGDSAGCAGPGIELSNTIDLEDYIGSRCMARLAWSTAAELSARFPVVSPPGRIDKSTLPSGCLTKSRKQLQGMQLIDGGTADNSALGTISDLAPEIASRISKLDATADGTSGAPFIVPIVVYASNDPGLDLSSTPNKTTPDALVPVDALNHAEEALVTPPAWLTRVANGLSPICAGANARGEAHAARCNAAVSGIDALIPHGVVVVAPSTSPAVSLPLGWALSGFSSARLREEALAQAKCGAPRSPSNASCRANHGYGELGTLLGLFH
jgi:hypothetical protein